MLTTLELISSRAAWQFSCIPFKGHTNIKRVDSKSVTRPHGTRWPARFRFLTVKDESIKAH
jgi:hypothetical protein